MRIKTTGIFYTVFAALVACSGGDATDERAAQNAPVESASPDAALENRIWMEDEAQAGRPGVMRIFLSDGSLIMDSCWETFRIAPWRRVDEDTIAWLEDTAEIEADIVDLKEDRLTIMLKLRGEDKKVEMMRKTGTPYLCPDIPK